MIETGNFSSMDQTRLFYRAPLCGEEAKPVIVIHGFAEHSGRYAEILTELKRTGFAPFAFDFRGHGHSEGKRGHISSFQNYVDDLRAAVRFVKKRNAGTALLLAHSMGALVATHFAIQEPESVDGLVLSSPLFGIRVSVPEWKKRLGYWMAQYWPSFGLPNNIDADELTHDKGKADVYRSDPLIFHHVTARWFEEILKATENSMSTASQLDRPFLLQLSDNDRIVSYEKSCQWYEKSMISDKSLHVYAGFYHEIYNERDRHKPIGDFIAWMLARWPREKLENRFSSADAEWKDQKLYSAGAALDAL